MRAAILLPLALASGLCQRQQDPLEGLPPVIRPLRKSIDEDLTRDEKGERVTPEQAERFFDASEDVAQYRFVRDPDIFSEVLYLLPRTHGSQWMEGDRLRDLLVFLNRKEAGSVLEAEAPRDPKTGEVRSEVLGYRKAAFLAIKDLHNAIQGMSAAERVKRVLEEANAGFWNDPKLRWCWQLAREYCAAALANDPAESVPELKPLALNPGPLREFALLTLARMDDPAAAAALRDFYGEDGASPRAAAFRFWSAFHDWPADLELPVLAPGLETPLRPFAGKARAVPQADFDAAKGPRLKVGAPDASIGRLPFLVEGDRASVVLTELNAEGEASATHYRLRKRGGLWVVGR